MRKILFFLPFLLTPALAGASHPSLQYETAYELNARAANFHRSVKNLRGNKYLKREAREFRRVTERLARQVQRPRKRHKLRRAINALNRQFVDLRYAVRRAYAPPRMQRRLKRQLRGMSLAIMDVELAVMQRGRYARSWSRDAYAFSLEDRPRDKWSRRNKGN